MHRVDVRRGVLRRDIPVRDTAWAEVWVAVFRDIMPTYRQIKEEISAGQ